MNRYTLSESAYGFRILKVSCLAVQNLSVLRIQEFKYGSSNKRHTFTVDQYNSFPPTTSDLLQAHSYLSLRMASVLVFCLARPFGALLRYILDTHRFGLENFESAIQRDSHSHLVGSPDFA